MNSGLSSRLATDGSPMIEVISVNNVIVIIAWLESSSMLQCPVSDSHRDNKHSRQKLNCSFVALLGVLQYCFPFCTYNHIYTGMCMVAQPRNSKWTSFLSREIEKKNLICWSFFFLCKWNLDQYMKPHLKSSYYMDYQKKCHWSQPWAALGQTKDFYLGQGVLLLPSPARVLKIPVPRNQALVSEMPGYYKFSIETCAARNDSIHL